MTKVQPMRRITPVAYGISLAVMLSALPATAATFYSPPVSANAGQPANVCILMSDGNYEVAGVQMDITWDASCMIPASGGSRPKCRSNPDTGKTVQSALRGGSTLRAIMVSFSDTEPIPDGELFCCEFRVTDNPGGSGCGVSLSNVIASTPRGQRTNARVGSLGGVRLGGGAAAGGGVNVGGAAGDARNNAPADTGSDRPSGGTDVADSGAPRQEAPAGGAAGDGAGRAAAEPGSGTSGGAPAGGAQGGVPGGMAGNDLRGGGQDMAQALDAGSGRIENPSREAGEVGLAVEPGSRPEIAIESDTAADADAEKTRTPTANGTPAPEATKAAPAVPTIAPTATPKPATPTMAMPTATPTVSSGFLGGCQLVVD